MQQPPPPGNKFSNLKNFWGNIDQGSGQNPPVGATKPKPSPAPPSHQQHAKPQLTVAPHQQVEEKLPATTPPVQQPQVTTVTQPPQQQPQTQQPQPESATPPQPSQQPQQQAPQNPILQPTSQPPTQPEPATPPQPPQRPIKTDVSQQPSKLQSRVEDYFHQENFTFWDIHPQPSVHADPTESHVEKTEVEPGNKGSAEGDNTNYTKTRVVREDSGGDYGSIGYYACDYEEQRQKCVYSFDVYAVESNPVEDVDDETCKDMERTCYGSWSEDDQERKEEETDEAKSYSDTGYNEYGAMDVDDYDGESAMDSYTALIEDNEEKTDSDRSDAYNVYGGLQLDENNAQEKEKEKETTREKEKSVSGEEGRKWNEEFQTLLKGLGKAVKQDEESDGSHVGVEQLKEDLKHLFKIQALSMEFAAAAKRIGAQIIRERHLPVEQKRYPPIDVGGMAGGEKFIAENIFFKFCFDVHDYYGGDEFAMKAAGLEHNGIRAYYRFITETKSVDLHVPLMIIIDYLGYRLVAVSVLPVGKDTLVYGSDDGGEVVHADDMKMCQLMREAAQHIGIKGHIVGSKKKALIYGPGDIEGHRGKDGNYYVLDTARVFPPRPPSSSFEAVIISPSPGKPSFKFQEYNVSVKDWDTEAANLLDTEETEKIPISALGGILVCDAVEQRNKQRSKFNKGATVLTGKPIYGDTVVIPPGLKGKRLYNCFRWEFVRYYGQQFCPLSSDAFTGFGRDKWRTHNKEVYEAENHLIQRAMEVVAKLDTEYTETMNGRELTQFLHDQGINVRHLGILYQYAKGRDFFDDMKKKNLLAVMVSEMIMRCVKGLLRAVMRHYSFSEQRVREEIVRQFNFLLGSSESSKNYFELVIKLLLMYKFELSHDRADFNATWSTAQVKLDVFQTLQAKLGISFSLLKPDFEQPNPLGLEDLESLEPVVSEFQPESFFQEKIGQCLTQYHEALKGKLLSEEYFPMSRKQRKKEIRNTLIGYQLEAFSHSEPYLKKVYGDQSPHYIANVIRVCHLLHLTGNKVAKKKVKRVLRDSKKVPVEVLLSAKYLLGKIYEDEQQLDKAEKEYKSGLYLANEYLNSEGKLGNGTIVNLLFANRVGLVLFKQERYYEIPWLQCHFIPLYRRLSPCETSKRTTAVWGCKIPIVLASFLQYSTIYGNLEYMHKWESYIGVHEWALLSSPVSSHSIDPKTLKAHSIQFFRSVERFEKLQFVHLLSSSMVFPFLADEGLPLAQLQRNAASEFVKAKKNFRNLLYFDRSRLIKKKQGYENNEPYSRIHATWHIEKSNVEWEYEAHIFSKKEIWTETLSQYQTKSSLDRLNDSDIIITYLSCHEKDYKPIRVYRLTFDKDTSLSPAFGIGSFTIEDGDDLPPGEYVVLLGYVSSVYHLSQVRKPDIFQFFSVDEPEPKKFVLVHRNENQCVLDTYIRLPKGEAVVDATSKHILSGSQDFTCLLTDKGKVYSYGPPERSLDQFLGNGTLSATQLVEPTLIRSLATKVVIGHYDAPHILAISTAGQLFSWGNNKCGQLGDSTLVNRVTPHFVQSLQGTPIIDIAAQAYVSVALSADGRVFHWGDVLHGRREHKNPHPTHLAAFTEKMIAIVVSNVEILGLNGAGVVSSYDGESLHVIAGLLGKMVVAIAAGRVHNLALTHKGKVYSWGYYHGGGGWGLDRPRFDPYLWAVEVPSPVVSISATVDHSCFLTDEGEVWHCGAYKYSIPHRLEGLRAQGLAKYVVNATAGENQIFVSIDESREPLERPIPSPLPLNEMFENRIKWISDHAYRLTIDKTEYTYPSEKISIDCAIHQHLKGQGSTYIVIYPKNLPAAMRTLHGHAALGISGSPDRDGWIIAHSDFSVPPPGEYEVCLIASLSTTRFKTLLRIVCTVRDRIFVEKQSPEKTEIEQKIDWESILEIQDSVIPMDYTPCTIKDPKYVPISFGICWAEIGREVPQPFYKHFSEFVPAIIDTDDKNPSQFTLLTPKEEGRYKLIFYDITKGHYPLLGEGFDITVAAPQSNIAQLRVNSKEILQGQNLIVDWEIVPGKRPLTVCYIVLVKPDDVTGMQWAGMIMVNEDKGQGSIPCWMPGNYLVRLVFMDLAKGGFSVLQELDGPITVL